MNAAYIEESALKAWRAQFNKSKSKINKKESSLPPYTPEELIKTPLVYSKPAKKRQYPESAIATGLVRWFSFAHKGMGLPSDHLLIHCKNESKQSAIAGSRMKAQGVRKGCADYLLLVPRGKSHGLALELKAPGKKPSPEQKEWLALVSGQGYYVAVCDSLPTAMDCIQSYLRQT